MGHEVEQSTTLLLPANFCSVSRELTEQVKNSVTGVSVYKNMSMEEVQKCGDTTKPLQVERQKEEQRKQPVSMLDFKLQLVL